MKCLEIKLVYGHMFNCIFTRNFWADYPQRFSSDEQIVCQTTGGQANSS